ncbi:MAG TPA: bifunctional UDP-sugar hydrolase/5'-nucleotidase [Candidatus Wallbacteria bacterium]|nr:bifunctional UDP-sugar hydrolase/5'-nucleotidase [Candidatus Wallbacteria bacterium]
MRHKINSGSLIAFKPLILIIALLLIVSNLNICDAKTWREPVKITILHTNDNHSRFLPFDKPGVGKDLGGMSRRYEYFKSVKKENPYTLILDGGDIFQGTPFYTFFKGEADLGAYALCGYDAACLGNHDPDDGFDNLFKQLEKTGFPMLCCNVFGEKNGRPAFCPFKIFERGGVRIAVIGVIGKDAWKLISNKLRKGYVHYDEAGMVSGLVRNLRPRVDVIVLLSHSGYEADLALAKKLDGVDVIVGSHSHTILKAPALVKNGSRNGLGGTLVLQAFECGIYAGRLDLFIGADSRIARYESGLKLIDSKIATNKKSLIYKFIDGYDSEMKGRISETIGDCETAMINNADLLLGTDIALGSYCADAILKSAGCDITIINSTTLRDAMPAGKVTIETILKILPFDNTIVVFEMRGDDISEMMNYIAANFGKNESFQYAGMTFTLDMKNKVARDVKIGGLAVSNDKVYKVSTLSYIAEGNISGDVLFKNAVSRKDTGIVMRDMIIDFIRANKKVIAPAAGRINLIK